MPTKNKKRYNFAVYQKRGPTGAVHDVPQELGVVTSY